MEVEKIRKKSRRERETEIWGFKFEQWFFLNYYFSKLLKFFKIGKSSSSCIKKKKIPIVDNYLHNVVIDKISIKCENNIFTCYLFRQTFIDLPKSHSENLRD